VKRDVASLASRTFDLLIVGGGIAGSAAAWDAAQRGLAVALVEAGDFGSGTSWNSLKTIHGGLRYLQRLDLEGLRESVRERRALLRIAPSLVKPLRFALPVHGQGLNGPLAFAAAARLYRILSHDRNDGLDAAHRLDPARLVRGAALERLAPGLAATAALVWDDAQVAGAEALVLAFVRAAAEHGAVVANYVEGRELIREGGRLVGARVHDTASGVDATVRAHLVLAAVGAGLDRWLERSDVPGTGVPWQSAINVVLRTPPPGECAVGGKAGGRHLFAVPWRGRVMIGTDYAPRGQESADRVTRLLDDARRAFPFLSGGPCEVALVHHGFVPGASAHALITRDRLVDHAGSGAPGLLSATAAKYTTARALAERAVDLALRRLARAPIACRTASTPLPMTVDEGAALEERTRRAVRDEMALHLADVVRRRTDIGTAERPDDATIDRVCRVMAAELGWSAAVAERETRELAAAYPGPSAGRAERPA
jgi:glycerol-3-phosphate dehydrogenase